MRREIDSIELRYLVALAVVGREGSFSRAADVLNYTQSAISQQISRLEQISGQRLLTRPGGPNPVSLTAAGRILLGHGEAIMARLNSALADMKALSSGESGELRIGCFQSVGTQFLPCVLRDFRDAWPKVVVKLVEAEDDLELLQRVEGGELDLTFVVYPMTSGPFAHCKLFDDPYVVVVPRESGLSKDRISMRPRELNSYPIITYAQMREVHSIEHRLDNPELADHILLRSNNNGTILGLVAAGIGVAVITRLSIEPFRDDVRVVPLTGVRPRVIGIAWHRDRFRTPALNEFVRLAKGRAASMSPPD